MSEMDVPQSQKDTGEDIEVPCPVILGGSDDSNIELKPGDSSAYIPDMKEKHEQDNIPESKRRKLNPATQGPYEPQGHPGVATFSDYDTKDITPESSVGSKDLFSSESVNSAKSSAVECAVPESSSEKNTTVPFDVVQDRSRFTNVTSSGDLLSKTDCIAQYAAELGGSEQGEGTREASLTRDLQRGACVGIDKSCPCMMCLVARSLDVEECIAMSLGESVGEASVSVTEGVKTCSLLNVVKPDSSSEVNIDSSIEGRADSTVTEFEIEHSKVDSRDSLESEIPPTPEVLNQGFNEGTEDSTLSESLVHSSEAGIESHVGLGTDSAVQDAEPVLESGEQDPDHLDESEDMREAEQPPLPDINYCFSKLPTRVTGAYEEFKDREQNFLKGCKWSPDGTCLLTNSDDNTLRLFNLPPQLWQQDTENLDEMSSVLKMKEGDLIYDYCWYPRMSSQDPVSCCLVSTCRDNPVHMWDAFTGELRCTYRPYDQADEIVSAYSVAFSNAGDKLYCGFNGIIRIFDINRPGRDCQTRKNKGVMKYRKNYFGDRIQLILDYSPSHLVMAMVQNPAPKPQKRRKKKKDRKQKGPIYQRGILSSIALSPDDSMYAVGSYSKTVSLYCATSGEMICLLDGHIGGVTQVKFSPNGNFIYSGGRKDSEIICWDIRMTGTRLFSLRRRVETNQRMYFDIDRSGRYVVSGNHDGTTSIWDVTSAQDDNEILEPMLRFRTHDDTTNGVSLHPYLPLLATGSGQQHFTVRPRSDDTSDSDEFHLQQIDNSLHLWWLGPDTVDTSLCAEMETDMN